MGEITKRNKCPICNKKITMMEEIYCKCKCDKIFCSSHKNAGHNDTYNTHKCLYDYVGECKKEMIKSNPVVIADKIIKI